MNTTTAAVAANNDGSATAVVFSPQDLEDTRVVQPFRDNNAALKYFRDSNESLDGIPTTDCIELTHTDPIEVAVIEHEATGQRYRFRADVELWPWR